MALMGWEWIVAIGIIAVLILWGPKKLPELARAIGEAKKEFQKASKEVTKPLSAEETKPSSDDLLIETAQMLGINTEGKTREQIAQEIVKKGKASNP
jgi:sec-independent protein translocase protein TatA